jgi:hypothetical protein
MIYRILHVFALCLVFLFSCKKAKIDTDFKTAQDNAIAENLFLDIPAQILPIINGYAPISNYALQNPVPSSANSQLFSCGNITVTSPFDTINNTYNFPLDFEIDFGSGCTDAFDNKIRKGKILVSLNNYWDSAGTEINITFDNYFVNNLQLKGTLILKYTDETHFTIDVTDGKYINTNYTISYTTQKSVFYQAGYATDTIISDDSYKITGNSSGIDRSSRNFTTNTIKPFIKSASCAWITSGVFEITPDGLSVRTVDYGDNNCDDKASVIINGNTFNIELN